jgi:hypothetical protein
MVGVIGIVAGVLVAFRPRTANGFLKKGEHHGSSGQ